MKTGLSIVRLLLLVVTTFGLTSCWGSASEEAVSTFAITSLLLDPNSCVDEDDPTTADLVEVDCKTLYVATTGQLVTSGGEESVGDVAPVGGRVFRSTDGGESWLEINNGLLGSNITDLVMDPEYPKTLYAGTENNGLFWSFDGGSSWSVAFGTSTINSITAIAVDPHTCQVFPCTDIYVGSQDSGVWVSRDGGQNWDPLNKGLEEDPAVTALTIFSYASFPSVLYAGTEKGHVYKYDPLIKEEWERLLPGLSDTKERTPLVIAVNPLIPSEIYIGTSGGAGKTDGGVFRSQDGGLTWSNENSKIPNSQNFSVRVLTFCIQNEPRCPPTVPFVPDSEEEEEILETQIDERSPDVLYAGVFGLSRTFLLGGETSWKNFFTTDSEIELGNNVSSLAIDTLRHTTLYAGTLLGFILKSQDAGTTWKRIDIEL